MSDAKQLLVVEQREIGFYNDQIIAVRVEDGTVYVPIRPICDSLDLSWTGQRERINRDAVLSELVQGVRVTRTPDQGGSQEMLCLPLPYLNGWLFGINANRVKESSRSIVIRYQKECYEVLFEAFQEGRLTTDPTFSNLLLNEESESVQAYRMAQAIMKMARQQILIESRIDEHDQMIASHTERIESLETIVGNEDRFITSEQAMHIAQGVKAIALEMGSRSGRNEFQGVYGELYRRFRIPSYRELPASDFQEAMNFLRDWYGSLVDHTVPF